MEYVTRLTRAIFWGRTTPALWRWSMLQDQHHQMPVPSIVALLPEHSGVPGTGMVGMVRFR